MLDDGVDLIVDYRTLVQVRSSGYREPTGALRIGIDRLRHDVDVLACFARDTGAWWFIPRLALDHAGVTRTVLLVEDIWRRAGTLSAYRDAWSVFADRAA
jgi:hypothetical protein